MMERLDNYLILAMKTHPKKKAIIVDEQQITYQELYDRVNTVAYFLKINGVKKGQRVVISSENNIEKIVVFFSCLRLGAIAVILSPRFYDVELKEILQDLQPVAIFFGVEQLKNFKEVDLTLKIVLDHCNDIDKIQDLYFYQTIISVITQEEVVNSVISVDLACIIYTSGSTGGPKGVMLSHRNMIVAAESINKYLGYKETDIILNVLPLSFDYGLYQVILSVFAKATLVLEKTFLWPPRLFKIISKNKISVLPLVATMVPPLLAAFSDHYDVMNVRLVTNTGVRMTHSHIDALQKIFAAAEIYSMYGLTECKRCSYVPPIKLLEKKDSIGIPMPNLEMKILDDKGFSLPPYTEGEIVIRSETIMVGYWNNKIETDKKIKLNLKGDGRILYSGDMGYCDDDGYFYLSGRKDDVVKIRGIKVNTINVEKIIERCPIVSEAVVVVMVNESDIEELVAFIVFIEENKKNKVDLTNFCRENCTTIEIPSCIVAIKNFPKNSNGKIDKKALKEVYLNSRSSGVLRR